MDGRVSNEEKLASYVRDGHNLNFSWSLKRKTIELPCQSKTCTSFDGFTLGRESPLFVSDVALARMNQWISVHFLTAVRNEFKPAPKGC